MLARFWSAAAVQERCVRHFLPSRGRTAGAQRLGCYSTGGPVRPEVASLLDRHWFLDDPSTKERHISLGNGASFCILHDDLLHPIIGGNKLRKVDALIPALLEDGTTDVVTCGGLQSAHITAVAAACAERGMSAHLLVRGERPPAGPTGYHLLARMFGKVTYIPRSEYANRAAMFAAHSARILAAAPPGTKLRVLKEGAAEPLALLGFVRLVAHLAAQDVRWREPHIICVDSGTGVSATGLAIAAALLDLPWRIRGIRLAGTKLYYSQHQDQLRTEFQQEFDIDVPSDLPLEWVSRLRPRDFGKVFSEDVNACQEVARCHGVLLDPIYSLAAWEAACAAARAARDHVDSTPVDQQSGRGVEGSSHICMLHTGGGVGLHGVAQRFPEMF